MRRVLASPDVPFSGRYNAACGILATDRRLIKRYGKRTDMPRLIKPKLLRGTENLGVHRRVHA